MLCASHLVPPPFDGDVCSLIPFQLILESQKGIEGLASCGAGMQSCPLISKLADSPETTCCVFGPFYVHGEYTYKVSDFFP